VPCLAVILISLSTIRCWLIDWLTDLPTSSHYKHVFLFAGNLLYDKSCSVHILRRYIFVNCWKLFSSLWIVLGNMYESAVIVFYWLFVGSLKHTLHVALCMFICSGCSEELIVLTQSLLSLDWLNHTKYGPLCCLVPHVGASVCLQLCPLLPRLLMTAFSQPSLTTPVWYPSLCAILVYYVFFSIYVKVFCYCAGP